MKLRGKVLVGLSGAALIYFGIGLGSGVHIDARRKSLEENLNSALVVGDSHQKIERVLHDCGIPVVYEEPPFNRYGAVIRVGYLTNSGVFIHIDLDEEKRMKQITVQKYYTGL